MAHEEHVISVVPRLEPNPLTRKLKRWLVLFAGWTFVALGLAGLFLPFLQGVLFIVIGLSILSSEYVWAHKLTHKLLERYPLLRTRINAARTSARTWLNPLFPPKSDDKPK